MASEMSDAIHLAYPDKFYIKLEVDYDNPGCYEIVLHKDVKGGEEIKGKGEVLHSKSAGAGFPKEGDIVSSLKSKIK